MNTSAFRRLKSSLTSNQLALIDAVWDFRLGKKEWPPVKLIEHKIETETITVGDIAKTLGGGVIYETYDNGQNRYVLTLLGVLLSGDGDKAELFLVKYLEYVRQRYAEDAEIERVTSAELTRDLSLASDSSTYIRELVNIGHLWGGSASLTSAGEWSAGFPSDINRLRFEKNIQEYLHRKALERYKKDEPVEANERYRSLFEAQRDVHGLTSSWRTSDSSFELGFDFVSNLTLRDFVARDWHEAQIVYKAEAWKACVVLCGSIIEAMLLDVVTFALKDLRVPDGIPKDPNRWKLAHLIELAKANQFLSGAAGSFANGLRDYRNLVHLDKQVRENLVANRHAADLAMRVVPVLHSELLAGMRKYILS